MVDLLSKIRLLKQEEIKSRKAEIPLQELKAQIKDLPPTLDFQKTLGGSGVALIAEVKKASPSAGVIRPDFNPTDIARAYQEGGAAAISVLTEKSNFGGELRHLKSVKEAVTIPVLRKDFILDEYQIYESRAGGADAILLISELLGKDEIAIFIELGHALGLSCLVESHSLKELEKVISAGAKMVGINNRDLKTLQINLETSLQLLPLIPNDRIKVSESGIKNSSQVKILKEAGVDAILVGETLLRSDDIVETIQNLLGLDKQ